MASRMPAACTAILILALACATTLRAATVVTGDVSPALPWSSSTYATLGDTGGSTLALDAGSQLAAANVVVGHSAGASGDATVSGSVTRWTVTYNLHLGLSGAGTLRVDNGGEVHTGYGHFGHETGATGEATITGLGSKWVIGYGMEVGRLGVGKLSIESGGQVSAAGDSYLGSNPGGTGEATVTGPGSSWTTAYSLNVGRYGSGKLTVADGGIVTAGTLYASLDDLHGDGTIIVTQGAWIDADLQFDSSHGTHAVLGFGTGGMLSVTAGGGVLGAGFHEQGSLTVADGIVVASSHGGLGYGPGSSGAATISGAGSKWTNSGSLVVGSEGHGSLRIEGGAQVSNTLGYVAYYSGSSGEVTVTGPGSRWINSNNLDIGSNVGATLRVEAGGRVDSTDGHLGYLTAPGTATITGAGSQWINSSALRIGQDGGGGDLTVADGGLVTAGILYASLADLHGDGTITATNGAVLDGDLRFDAAHGTQAVLGFGTGGTLTVTAGGGNLGCGYKGQGSLTVTDGIAVASTRGFLGYDAGATGVATITGTGSKWNNSSFLDIGSSGRGTLRIEAGGQVTNTTGYLGYAAGSTGEATVTGAGSKWTHSSALFVGNSGSGSLRIEAGGQVSAVNALVGNEAGSKGDAVVTGSGSKLTSSQLMSVGSTGHGTLRVEAGGQVSSGACIIGRFSAGSGQVTITGPGSLWSSSSLIDVGGLGIGTLNITNGGMAAVFGTLTIARDAHFNDSFVNMATGGMLALRGNAASSLAQFLGLVSGTDRIRYWNNSLGAWALLTAGANGVDYTLAYQASGSLTGYTLLTVGTLPALPGDFSGDGIVDGADFIRWQGGHSPLPNSRDDLALWESRFGTGGPGFTTVPEPGSAALTLLATVTSPRAIRRRRRGTTTSRRRAPSFSRVS